MSNKKTFHPFGRVKDLCGHNIVGWCRRKKEVVATRRCHGENNHEESTCGPTGRSAAAPTTMMLVEDIYQMNQKPGPNSNTINTSAINHAPRLAIVPRPSVFVTPANHDDGEILAANLVDLDPPQSQIANVANNLYQPDDKIIPEGPAGDDEIVVLLDSRERTIREEQAPLLVLQVVLPERGVDRMISDLTNDESGEQEEVQIHDGFSPGDYAEDDQLEHIILNQLCEEKFTPTSNMEEFSPPVGEKEDEEVQSVSQSSSWSERTLILKMIQEMNDGGGYGIVADSDVSPPAVGMWDEILETQNRACGDFVVDCPPPTRMAVANIMASVAERAAQTKSTDNSMTSMAMTRTNSASGRYGRRSLLELSVHSSTRSLTRNSTLHRSE